jgi:hydroxymethylpyrimidine/phosphomethylpyrimidine kinase
MKAPFCVLSIAGSDSGGGAGIQADQRTIQALGGHALTAVTAVTAQDTRRVAAWSPVSPALIRSQVVSAMGGFPVAAVKTGLLPGAAAVRAVAAALARFPAVPLVIDPVVASTSGTRFLSETGVSALQRLLFPMAAVITPNWPEAEALSGIRVRTHAQAAKAASRLAAQWGRPVLVKGGHGPRGVCRDCLVVPDGTVAWFACERVRTRNTHGTGCVLASAIAVWLGRRVSLHEAIWKAQSFLQGALESGRGLNWGRGRGPAFTVLQGGKS